MRARRFYEFGPYRLHPAERLLLRGSDPISLTPKAFDTLLVLVENSGHLLQKDELLDTLWPDTFVEERNLAQQVFLLRKALGDGPDGRPYIETVPKRGYRFAVPAAEVFEDEAQAPLPLAKARSRRAVASLLTVGALVAVAVYLARQYDGRQSAEPAGRAMLAVLPFENLSADPEEHICDGLTEEMITQLGSLAPERLGVIARTSAMQYKGTDKGVDGIGQELGVDYILEGSVRREAERVRISVQLIRVSDQTHLWAQNYDRDLRDILLLQSDVAQAVARRIEIQLTPQEQARLPEARPVHRESHEDYLRGRYYWNKRTAEGLLQGREHFERALDKDPLNARAYSGLADAYTNLTFYGVLPAKEAMPRAKAAALRALEIDDTLAEAHASLGMAVFYYDWDWSLAEAELRRAIELNPGYSTARYWYAVFLADLGRADESIQAMQRALEVDPLSARTRCDVGWTYFFARRYDEAIEQFRKTVEIIPGFPMAHHILGETYAENGMFEEAIAELEKAHRLSPGGTHFPAMIGYAHARSGNYEEAQRILDELKERPEPNLRRGAIDFATLCGALDKRDEAFAWLEMAFEDRSPRLVRLGAEPWWDCLRDDPRFHELMRRMNLPPR